MSKYTIIKISTVPVRHTDVTAKKRGTLFLVLLPTRKDGELFCVTKTAL